METEISEKDSVTIKLHPDFNKNSGLVSFISWTRIEQMLLDSGELLKGETIEGVKVSDHGVNYYIKKEH